MKVQIDGNQEKVNMKHQISTGHRDTTKSFLKKISHELYISI